MFSKIASFAAAAALTTLVAAAMATPAHAGMTINGMSLNGIGLNGISPNGVEQVSTGFAIDGIELPAAR